MIYKAEDIFENIPDDPNNVILKFPPEVLEKTGWKPGTVLSIIANDGVIEISTCSDKQKVL